MPALPSFHPKFETISEKHHASNWIRSAAQIHCFQPGYFLLADKKTRAYAVVALFYDCCYEIANWPPKKDYADHYKQVILGSI
jgi:hypothetical protein